MMRKNIIIKFTILFLTGLLLNACVVFNKSEKHTKIKNKEKNYLNYKFLFYEGNTQMMLGNYALSMQYFFKCNKLMPNRATPYFRLSQLYYRIKDYHNALKYAELAHNRSPENLWISEFLINLYEGFNQYGKAEDLLKEVLKQKQKDYTYLMELARIKAILGKDAEALKLYNELESQFGILEEISLAKEKLFLEKKNYGAAEKEIDKLIAAYPDRKKYIKIKGDLLIFQRKYNEAKELYEKAIDQNPNTALFYTALAEIYQLKKLPEKAITTLKKAFACNDMDIQEATQIIYSYMHYYRNDNKIFPQIESIITTLISTHPETIEAHAVYSDFLTQENYYKEAREELIKIKNKAKDNYLLWQQLIYLDVSLEKNKDLYVHATEAISLFPNQPLFYLYAGIASFVKTNYAKAIAPLQEGLEIIVDDTSEIKKEFYTYLGEAYYRLKKTDSAFYFLDLAIAKDSNNYSLMNNYSYYLSLADTNLDKALTMIKQVIKQYPENQTYLDTYAWVLYKRKDYRKALQIIKLAVKNGGQISPVIMEHMGDILYRNGNKEEAIATWKKAQKLGKASEFLLQKIKEGRLIE